MSKVIFGLFCFCFVGQVNGFEPTELYAKTNVAGFAIYLSSALADHAAERNGAIQEFRKQVSNIEGAVDPQVLPFLRSVPIWLEWRNKTNGAAEYHPSREWLVENGYNPEKARGIEISNARNFVKWSEQGQPWMLFHELTHAFHDQVLGWDDPEIKAAFEKARESKRYESVSYVNGRKLRAYALTDEKEYFAEICEAYFGRNDFYPFTRSELETFDEAGYAVASGKWKRAIPAQIPAANPSKGTSQIAPGTEVQ